MKKATMTIKTTHRKRALGAGVALLLLLSLVSMGARAQEFRCNVTINSQKLMQSTQGYDSGDKKVFDNMKQAMEDLINGRKWTAMTFEQVELIDCSIMLILTTRPSATEFGGQLQIQLKRPVYNSTYSSGIFNYLESNNFTFTYNESQPLDFDISNYYGNLSSVLGYYCYIMLGVYMDSFAPNAGEPYYAMAQQVQQAAENSGYSGWRNSDGQKSRYWFMENHTNSAYEDLHSVYYKYHRLGLDMMTKDQQQARQNIIEALQDLQKVHKKRTNLLSVQQFVDVKIQELVSIFTPAPPQEQKQVYDVIHEVSPINVVKLKDFNTK